VIIVDKEEVMVRVEGGVELFVGDVVGGILAVGGSVGGLGGGGKVDGRLVGMVRGEGEVRDTSEEGCMVGLFGA
jgi:hypothetical protein